MRSSSSQPCARCLGEVRIFYTDREPCSIFYEGFPPPDLVVVLLRDPRVTELSFNPSIDMSTLSALVAQGLRSDPESFRNIVARTSSVG